MKLGPRAVLVIAAFVCSFAIVTEAAEESLADKIKRIFQPTPTPAPRKHRKTTSTKKKELSPSPTPSAKPKVSRSPRPTESETPKPSPSVSPKRRKEISPPPPPTPEESPIPSAKKHRKVSPTPSATETPTLSPSATPIPQTSETPAPTPSPSPKKKGAPVSIAANEIAGYENYSSAVRRIVDLALDLASRGLDYKYGSADPASGGMDCSGFVYYVLTNIGMRDVPRDSSEQYAWLRKAGRFEAVISRKEDSFELGQLAPGDVLFWTGTYNIERDPPITHAMIYLGREKSTNHRIMVGASDGRTYRGESRYGVSVFDFKISTPAPTGEGRLSPSFVGYGHVPGLR
jgi:cell wall-associated NlpC family hydrolase